jgi:1,4-dihydroxy-2-naphthoate octaprenyltransferase
VLYKYVSIYGMGLILAVAYSAGSRPLKYLGLGDLTVFMAFGPLLVIAAAWACAQDPFNLNLPRLILFSIPAAFLVVAILHANNHRDIKGDAKSLAHTVAVRMGQRLSLMYYEFLVVAPPIISVIMALVWKEYFGMLAGGLTLPLGLRLALTARSKVLPRDIDAETAKLMLLYGLVTSLGIAVVG